jgi:hypothetical protein
MKQRTHSTSKGSRPKRSDTIDIHIGIYYELPDGRIAYTYGWNGIEKEVSYQFENGKFGTVSDIVFQAWKPRRDLKDYPNSKDPALPYEFDLHYDLKRMSDLIRFVDQEDDPKILQHLRLLVGKHKIKFINIRKGFK